MKTPTKLTLALATFSLSIIPADTQAQNGFLDRLFGVESQQQSYRPISTSSHRLQTNAFALDDLADQMTWRYGWELRRHRCADSVALHTQMKSHTGATDRLVRAYEGTCPRAFKKAACDVRSSVSRLEKLAVRAEVSYGVTQLIKESCPLSTYVHDNAAQFRPVLPKPVYDPVYFRLGQEVSDVNRLALTMSQGYNREVGHSCGCASTKAMLAQMRNHTQLTTQLTNAYRGTCPKTFKKAACNVRESLSSIERLSQRVPVSRYTTGLMEQACPKVTFIHTNSKRFQPYTSNLEGRGNRGGCGSNNNYNYDSNNNGWNNRDVSWRR